MGDVTPMNRRERRHWNQYVAEARDVYSDIVLRDPGTNGEDDPGDLIRVYVPTVEKLNALNQAEQTGDVWEQLDVLLGNDVARFKPVAEGAPITALVKLIGDIITDLGLSASPGNVPASSA